MKEEIKKIVEELLDKMTVSVDSIDILDDGFGGKTRILIKSPDSRILIGKNGEHLFSLSHLVNKIINKGHDEKNNQFGFIVDVNNYQYQLVQELRTKATILADRARSFKKDIEMEPMPSYERMIVHTFFENDTSIKTASKGEGLNRHVVLCYKEEARQENF